jgi:hypothetical protein
MASMEKDTAQLRSAVYDLARIKLQAELPINISEKRDLAFHPLRQRGASESQPVLN